MLENCLFGRKIRNLHSRSSFQNVYRVAKNKWINDENHIRYNLNYSELISMRFYFIIFRPLPNASLCFRCGPALSRCHRPCNFGSGDRWAMKPRDLEKIPFLGNSDILVKFRWIIFTKLLQFWSSLWRTKCKLQNVQTKDIHTKF